MDGVVRHIGCAAYALTIAMNPAFPKAHPLKAAKMALALQQELGWAENEDDQVLLSELDVFVEKYPKLKLTVLVANVNCILKVVQGAEFDKAEAKKNSIYLIYDPVQQHYGATKTPQQFFRNLLNQRNLVWCFACDKKYQHGGGHDCEEGLVVEKKAKKEVAIDYQCKNCHVFGPHDCPKKSCKMCFELYDKDNYEHRCILIKPERTKVKTLLYGEEGADKKSFAGLVWDIESVFEEVETIHEHPEEFELDETGRYTGEAVTVSRNVSKHIPFAVSFMDMISGHKETFYGTDCLEKFLASIFVYNGGKCILYAHNSSGYDTRLVFDTLAKMVEVDAKPVLRGAKFIELKTKGGNIIFRDSMLHMPGSLRKLGESFGLKEEKGFFPYLFATIDNINANYVGPIPERKHFDLASSLRDPKDLVAFDEWYSGWEGREDWDLKKELLMYLDQDVKVLGQIMKTYHTEGMALNGISPLFNSTGPSYVHEVIVAELVKELELPDPKEDMPAYKERVNELARKSFWGVQKPSEYHFARRALRGGKTDTRCIYYKLSQEEIDRGVKICYQDMVSMYPTQQVKYDYPTGIPTINVYDIQYYPCSRHENNVSAKCSCRDKYADRFCTIVDRVDSEPPCARDIVRDPEKYFGIWCITWECPKTLFHPVLVSYNADTLKCVASLDDKDYKEHCSTSPEVIRALEKGYKIKRVHRFDAYKKSPPLWKNVVWRFYLRKMIYSRTQPPPQEFEKLIADYTREYGEEVGQMIRDTDGLWEKNLAKKTICKRDVNCGWGKQCQQPNQGQNLVADHDIHGAEVEQLFQNLTAGNYKWGGSTKLGEDTYMYKFTHDSNAPTDLHNFYLPAGLFVPAYGRLELLTQMDRLGSRVIYHDTDSITYKYDPRLYNIPQSEILGGWEVEDIDAKHGGLVEFVGLAPKTYGLKAMDGTTMVKAKGISLKIATENIVNFESMAKIAKDYLATGVCDPLMVPTTNFNYRIGGEGVTTHRAFKALKFNPTELKGELRGAIIYPFGHE